MVYSFQEGSLERLAYFLSIIYVSQSIYVSSFWLLQNTNDICCTAKCQITPLWNRHALPPSHFSTRSAVRQCVPSECHVSFWLPYFTPSQSSRISLIRNGFSTSSEVFERAQYVTFLCIDFFRQAKRYGVVCAVTSCPACLGGHRVVSFSRVTPQWIRIAARLHQWESLTCSLAILRRLI